MNIYKRPNRIQFLAIYKKFEQQYTAFMFFELKLYESPEK